jgi:predicted nucleic acid-binding Zn ribbon protein
VGNEEKRENKFKRQWMGIFGGLAVGWALTIVFPSLQERFSLFSVVIWSAVIGGVLTSLDGFMRAGAAFIRSDNHFLNLAIALGILVLILVVIFLLFRAI